MRNLWSIPAVCLLAAMPVVPAFAGNDTNVETQIVSCGNGVPGGVNCVPSKTDLKEARNAYARGLKLESRKSIEQAFAQFDEASRLVPQNTQFFSAREVAKSQLVFQHAEHGDALLATARLWQAAAEYRAALKLDPDNQYMQQRLEEALHNAAPPGPARVPVMPVSYTHLDVYKRQVCRCRAGHRAAVSCESCSSRLPRANALSSRLSLIHI